MKTIKQFRQEMQKRIVDAKAQVKRVSQDAVNANYDEAIRVLRIAEIAGLQTRNEFVSVYGDSTTLNFTIDAVNGLKDKPLVGLIAMLSETIGEPSSSDYVSANMAERSVRFGDWQAAFRVNIDLDIPEDSATCRKVCVGETTQTVKQYKIECNDGE
jgi:hypothetical protein